LQHLCRATHTAPLAGHLRTTCLPPPSAPAALRAWLPAAACLTAAACAAHLRLRALLTLPAWHCPRCLPAPAARRPLQHHLHPAASLPACPSASFSRAPRYRPITLACLCLPCCRAPLPASLLACLMLPMPALTVTTPCALPLRARTGSAHRACTAAPPPRTCTPAAACCLRRTLTPHALPHTRLPACPFTTATTHRAHTACLPTARQHGSVLRAAWCLHSAGRRLRHGVYGCDAYGRCRCIAWLEIACS